MSNIIYSVISRACDRLLIGKTFWKGLAMPSFLYGSEIIYYTRTEIQKLQVIDNKVYRGILRAPSSTAIESLRGDVGASSSMARDMKNKLMFVKHCLEEKTNALVRHIFSQQFQNEDTKFMKQLKEYMNLAELTLRDIKDMKFADIKTVCNEWDNKTWMEAAAKKTTLGLYIKYKSEIKQESWFDNSDGAKLMFRARTDIKV